MQSSGGAHPAAHWRGGVGGVLAAALLALLLTGCATAPQSRDLAGGPEALPDLPPRVELRDTPFHPQEDYQCGPAALATVLEGRGLDVSLQGLIDEVYLPAREGTLQAEMRAAVRAHDLLAYRLEPDLEAILREVAAGHPVVVFQNLGLGMFPEWHFAVVIGYDLEAGEIILRSGTHERHVNEFARFERTWSRGERWAFIPVAPDELSATAEPLNWLRAVNELEVTGALAAAATGYRTAIDEWPDHPVAYVGLANVAMAQDDPEAAESPLRELIERAPEVDVAWNNLAHVLLARDCTEPARAAAACAVALSGGEDASPYAPTLRTLERAAPSPDGACDPAPDCPAGRRAD
ncbi:PA2778 family cysteine peptidase [Thioalkalivibrio sp. ALR17-21]|uniref:PA2778 family cysteine peptidase n=1 Tax=Thioalkalivibrio sp. ALR17-21 TaxID=1269813 RepID=UPI000686D871|nr:PA2778 family cysteine peptidase [Thioalkalivibrio sp. ALR17-21]